ncbi:serine/threonine protein kinase [Oceanobacillus limi]|uniref:Serine/threonine protein kinase n=1 Tax=Oceanobacillus limi TaxID=930131 RepID=A0A1I0CH85_9BACI|nr:serine/threonine protein kinase [Oceanobacillus limi]SET18981.1 serine/threonine protein kinase [Oceanobacillus limi]
MDELVQVELKSVVFQLKEAHDFTWLADLGEVFSVFDEQDSGNICFGVEIEGEKKFVKYAGAKTKEYLGNPDDAIKRLKDSVELYKELASPYLVRLTDNFELENGYALVFDWFDGECLHSHWAFPPEIKNTHPNSPYYRFKQLAIEDRIGVLNHIFEFHVFVEQKKYVAIDFYDGSILYNFKENKTLICDIDLYQRKPYENKMGRMWGSSRFMSPEEFELGASIDERTNVYNMGAVAFCLVGGERDRSKEKWEANLKLYQVACKATERERLKRYRNVHEFYTAWRSAINSFV